MTCCCVGVGRKCVLTELYPSLKNLKVVFFSLSFISLIMLHQVVAASILFEEVTQTAGISHVSPSFGASWGDFNNDRKPDIWVSNHYSRPSLYLNNGDGTFTDIVDSIWTPLQVLEVADTHGATWADFDNDGDQDLLELSGGNGGGEIFEGQFNHMFVNLGGKFVEQAEVLGLQEPLSRSRTPTWVDWNNDGLLDVVLTAWLRPDGQGGPGIFTQLPNGGFVNDNALTGFTISGHTPFAHLANITGDSKLDLLFHSNLYPLKIYDIASAPFQELTTSIAPNPLFVSDVATADFNANQSNDFFLARRGDPSGTTQVGANQIKGRFRISGKEHGVNFKTSSDVTFDVYLEWIGLDKIYIGSTGINPVASNFTLSSTDPAAQGILAHTSGTDIGVYIGYNTLTQEWEFSASNNNINFYIDTVADITGVAEVGFNSAQQPSQVKLWRLNNGVFEDKTIAAKLNVPLPCRTVTSGDFDNDMDIDLYLVCTKPDGNLPNVVFENMGDGTFQQVVNSAGAGGSSLGRGENVVTADYDGDGFLDLFVTNGLGPAPFHNGPHQLFRNKGNTNHWLQVDLEGVISNRDGIGARIYAINGAVSQYREQAGGVHLVSQNYKRLHFGLGSNTKVDQLIVEWPSGQRQVIENIPANQVIRVIEPSGLFVAGKPVFSAGYEDGVFLWKDTFDGPYHLRTIGKGVPTKFKINVLSTAPVLNTVPVKLEPADILLSEPYGFTMTSVLSSWQDGVDFGLTPGANALISVTQDGIANPRQFNVGLERTHMSPVGWVKPWAQFPLSPAFQSGLDLGLFSGLKNTDSSLQLQWSGNGVSHYTNTTVMASRAFTNISFNNLESDDRILQGANYVEASMHIVNAADGLSLQGDISAMVGVAYLQDGLFSPDTVNSTGSALGEPDAYRLPLATPYGEPVYNSLNDAGVYVWKSDDGVWHLRLSPGGGTNRITGTINSDKPVTTTPYRLETNDVLDNSVPTQITFILGASKGWQDGIDFVVAKDAVVTLEFQSASGNATDLLFIGKDKWPVGKLPVAIGGW